MTRTLNLYELLTCSLAEHALELTCNREHWNEVNLCEQWLASPTCKSLVEQDPTMISQSATYISNNIVTECGPTLIVHADHRMNAASVGWFGYVTMYWMLSERTSPRDILKNYDVAEILSQSDVLHTVSSSVAINEMKMHCTKAAVIRDKIGLPDVREYTAQVRRKP